VEGSCEHSIEPSGSIKCCKVLEGLNSGGSSRRSQLHNVFACKWVYNKSEIFSTRKKEKHVMKAYGGVDV
jgi:hypothetical protein